MSQVLNMHGKVLTVRHQAVNRRKDNRFAVALDSEQNNIHVKDIVKVIDGPHSVRALTSSLSLPVGECVVTSCLPFSRRAVRGRSATCSGASPSSTVKSWWRTAACLSVRRATWCWQAAPRWVSGWSLTCGPGSCSMCCNARLVSSLSPGT